jgi:hypothetical protein
MNERVETSDNWFELVSGVGYERRVGAVTHAGLRSPTVCYATPRTVCQFAAGCFAEQLPSMDTLESRLLCRCCRAGEAQLPAAMHRYSGS